MQTSSLPGRVDPWRLAAERGRLDGALPVAALSRLAAASHRASGLASAALSAGIDANGVRFIEGVVRAEVELVCQRCLEPFRWPLEAAVRLGLARDEAEAGRLQEPYEPLLVPEGVVRVADLIEDELLLALPQIPRHADQAECAANGYQPPRSDGDQPLAVLGLMLQDGHGSR